MAVAERRGRRYEEALAHLVHVGEVDRDYPGLALERGLVFEASGKSGEALREYEVALERAPQDPDLMLRVGCARVASGKGVEAEKMLRDVMAKRQGSAKRRTVSTSAFERQTHGRNAPFSVL